MRVRFGFFLCALLLAPAAAQTIPLDEPGFTKFIQQKLQLYSPAPVRVTAPFELSIGPQVGANLVFAVAPLHDACVAAPAQCPDKVHDYVQGIVHRFPSAYSGPAPAALLPPDRPGFMAWIAGELEKRLAGDRILVDGTVVSITRPGGHAIALDQGDYYKLCAESGFNCRDALLQTLDRTAAWLTVADPMLIRVSPHIMADCDGAVAAKPCVVKPSAEAMAAFYRPAFANLAEACFKPVAKGGVVPVTNADRVDLGLDVDAALERCAEVTRQALGPAKFPPPAPDGIVTLFEPYAASRALFAGDWTQPIAASGGHLIIAVPARDVLIFMNGDTPEKIATLAARAKAAFDASPLAISSDVYRWNGTGWELATAASTMGIKQAMPDGR